MWRCLSTFNPTKDDEVAALFDIMQGKQLQTAFREIPENKMTANWGNCLAREYQKVEFLKKPWLNIKKDKFSTKVQARFLPYCQIYWRLDLVSRILKFYQDCIPTKSDKYQKWFSYLKREGHFRMQ